MDDMEESYATDPRNATWSKHPRPSKSATVPDEQAEVREADPAPDSDFSRDRHDQHVVGHAERPNRYRRRPKSLPARNGPRRKTRSASRTSRPARIASSF